MKTVYVCWIFRVSRWVGTGDCVPACLCMCVCTHACVERAHSLNPRFCPLSLRAAQGSLRVGLLACSVIQPNQKQEKPATPAQKVRLEVP